jgi:hypothetical protein
VQAAYAESEARLLACGECFWTKIATDTRTRKDCLIWLWPSCVAPAWT